MIESVTTLGMKALVVMGQSPPGESYNSIGNGDPLLNGPTEFGPVHPTPAQWTTSPKKFCEEGDVLFCVRGATAGRINTADQRYCLGRGIAAIRGVDGACDTGFLRHALASGYARFQARGVGSTFINVSAKELASFPLPELPLSEQQRIAAILDAADALRAKRRESIEQLDALLQSTFLDMFGDPVTNPKRWPVRPLGELAENKDSVRVPIKQSDRDCRSGEYPYYGSVGVIDDIDDYLFEGEHLLISEDGKHLETRGRPIACIADGRFWVNNHAHVLAFNGKAELTYLAYQLEMRPIRQFVTGIDQVKLNRKKLDLIPTPLPPLDLQHRFATIVESIEQQKNRYRAHLAELDALFGSLQHRAFNGEL